MVTVNGERITLAQYASRMNIKLLRPADFNQKLREHEVNKSLTVQKICKVCRDEKQVRDVLSQVWDQPKKTQEVIFRALNRNQNVFEFEQTLAN